MSDDLVERVAQAMCASVEARTSDLNVVKALGYDSVQAFIDAAWPNYITEARAAIAIALEEAARVCRKIGASYLEQDGTRAVADECADAIEKLMVTKDV